MKKITVSIILLFISIASYGQLWESFGSPEGDPRCMYVDSSENILYIGGGFATINGEIMRGVGKWDGTSWDDLDIGMDVYNVYGTPNNVLAITKFKGEIIAAGAFSTAGDTNSKFIARWDGAAWLPFNGQPDEAVLDVMVYNNKLYVCGVFDSLGTVPANGVGMWDGENWHDVGAFPNYYPNPPDGNYMYSLVEYQGNIYVSGAMKDSLQNTHHLAWLDGTIWHYFDDDLKGGSAGGWDLEVYKDELYVAGSIDRAAGNYGNAIQRWNGLLWDSVGSGMGGPNNTIWKLKVWDEKLYAVGAFTEAGGIPANKVAYWDGVRWCGLGSEFDNNILALEFYDGTLHVSGGFKIIDGDSIIKLAKWNGGNYTDTCSIPVGVNELHPDDFSLSLFPNPATDQLHLSFSFQQTTKPVVTITNLLGEQTLTASVEKTERVIDISMLPGGIYFITLKTERGNVVQKFMKQ